MKGCQIENGFIDFDKTDFNCPHCNNYYNDRDGKCLNKQQKEKGSVKKMECKICEKPFFITFNYKSEYVSFK